jgi:hypothetical protein
LSGFAEIWGFRKKTCSDPLRISVGAKRARRRNGADDATEVA